MQQLLDSSKQNQTALRYFIQYEVLQKKPIQESYKTFCKVMGDETMDYSEFEFWYWRFYNGDVDVDFDRREPLELLQLPVEIVDKVAKKLDPSSRATVRKVCKTLQTVIDSQKVKIEEIIVCISNTPFASVNGMEIAFRDKRTSQEQLNLIISYLRQLLKCPKSEVAWFCLYLPFDYWPNLPRPSLKNLNQIKFNVKSLVISSEIPVSSKEAFSLFRPGVLEHIEIDNHRKGNLNIQELIETDHYRQAKSVDLSSAGVVTRNRQVFWIKDMVRHLSSSHVSVFTITAKEMVQLKEHFQQLGTFNKLQMTICKNPFNIIGMFEELAMTLGVAVQKDGKVLGPIPGSNDYMEFSLEDDCIRMERKRC